MGNQCTTELCTDGDPANDHIADLNDSDIDQNDKKSKSKDSKKDNKKEDKRKSSGNDANSNKPMKTFRVLLLGTGESGKSTFTQQLNLLHNVIDLSDEEKRRMILPALHENIAQCISATAANAVRIGLKFEEGEQEMVEIVKMSTKMDSEFAKVVKTLWNSAPIQTSYQHKSTYWILDTCDWLMANIDRFAHPSYVPTREDVVMSRRRTTGISEHNFIINNTQFTIIDVGGQRSERRKWVQFFADVHCIVFFVSVVGFCRVLFEDRNTFQMKESLELFTSTFRVPVPPSNAPRIDNDWNDYVFETTPIHIVFNKLDMLPDALTQFDLKACFPNYKGPNTQGYILRFLQQTFSDRVMSIRSPPDSHFISATNEGDVRELFTKLTTFLIEKEKAGIALNAFMRTEAERGDMRTHALPPVKKEKKTKEEMEDDNKKSQENEKKKQKNRLMRIRELTLEK